MHRNPIIVYLGSFGLLLFLLAGSISAKSPAPAIDYYAEEKAKQAYLLASALYAQQLYQEAIAEAVKLLALYPNTAKVPDTLYLIGTIHADTSNPKNNPLLAIKTWEELLARYPEYSQAPTVLMKIAETYESVFNWDKAAQTYARIIQLYPKSEFADDALFWAGCAEYTLARFDKAKQHWTTIVDKYSSGTEVTLKLNSEFLDDAYMMIAEVSLIQQDTTAAVTAYEKVVSLHPASPYLPVALFQLGKIYQETYYQPTYASSYYQRLLEYTSDPTWQRLAKLKLDQCQKKYSEPDAHSLKF
ncbi:MAG: tetratricopeptide repeat protein [bacterium]|nr:tetratricopeptide repeat protein [bacterium]